MGRSLRFVPKDHLVEITCRTLQGRLLLRPSAELNEIIIGALGRAQRRYGLRLCGFAFLSNHFHLLAAPDDAKQMADFMCLVNSKIAREIGRLHNWREKVWGRHYTATVLAQEDESHVQRLRYIVAHGVKEGLVERVLDWPGVHCAPALLTGKHLLGLLGTSSASSAPAQPMGLHLLGGFKQVPSARGQDELLDSRWQAGDSSYRSPMLCWQHPPRMQAVKRAHPAAAGPRGACAR